MTGNTKQALAWAEDGLKACPDYAELYRIKAMAYIADEDFESAKECVDKAIEKEEYTLAYMVSLIVENELGNKDKVKEIKEKLKEHDVELSEKTEKYLKGKITAKQMFTEGTGDVE